MISFLDRMPEVVQVTILMVIILGIIAAMGGALFHAAITEYGAQLRANWEHVKCDPAAMLLGAFVDGIGFEAVKEATRECTAKSARADFAGANAVFGGIAASLNRTTAGLMDLLRTGVGREVDGMWGMAQSSMSAIQMRMAHVGRRLAMLFGRVRSIFARVSGGITSMVFIFVTMIASVISFTLFMKNVFIAVIAIVIAMVFILWWIFPPIIGFAAFLAGAIGVGFGVDACFHPKATTLTLRGGKRVFAGELRAGDVLENGNEVLGVVWRRVDAGVEWQMLPGSDVLVTGSHLAIHRPACPGVRKAHRWNGTAMPVRHVPGATLQCFVEPTDVVVCPIVRGEVVASAGDWGLLDWEEGLVTTRLADRRAELLRAGVRVEELRIGGRLGEATVVGIVYGAGGVPMDFIVDNIAKTGLDVDDQESQVPRVV